MSKAKWLLISLIALMVVVVDFRLFLFSVLADAMLISLLMLVIWKFPDSKTDG